jgi:hypothetical protein
MEACLSDYGIDVELVSVQDLKDDARLVRQIGSMEFLL